MKGLSGCAVGCSWNFTPGVAVMVLGRHCVTLINNQTPTREKRLTGPYTEVNPNSEVRALIVVFINNNGYFLYLP